ncbi:hypothetical protein G5I_14288 [Acromyrmex echinatior]|uniref:Uncharacterized protein n=1 Tax=Acromyrmex echinatior TaxID=103372 RepID=F4X6Z8_ACREC|nr:hypothetical protein G5I_14288 [Acromyrmex echinatior]
MRKHTGFQLMGGQVDNEEYLRVSEIAEKRVLSWIKISSAERDCPLADRRAYAGRSDRPTLIFLEFRFTDFRSVTFTTAKRAFGKLAFFFRPGRRWMRAGGLQGGTENVESKPGRVGRKERGWVCRPDPRAITFSFSACTVLEFMPDGELMRDRFVVITRRRRRRDGKSRKTSGLASLSPRERAVASETEKQGTEDGEGQR